MHARICKTYLDALEGDKGLPTLYGAIVGLSALGNHAVRTLLLPHLPSILSRLQDNTDSINVSTLSGPGEKTGSAGGREEGKQDKGKRKRSDSMDNNNNNASTNPPVNVTSSSNGGAKKFNKNSASKVLQEQVTRGMCREALIKALGKMRYSLVVLFTFSFFLLFAV